MWRKTSDASFAKSIFSFYLVDLLCIGHALNRLGNARMQWCGQNIHHGLGTDFRQGVMQGRGRRCCINRAGHFQHHRACIQPQIHAHDGDTAFQVSRHDGALYGCGTAPAWKQRGMDIEAAMFWRFQNRFRQQQAIGHNDCGIGPQSCKALLLFGCLQGNRCANFNASSDSAKA